MQEMQIRTVLPKEEEKLLQQKLRTMFALRSQGEDYKAEYDYIRRKTEELIYIIPSALLLASDEFCSAVYLRAYRDIDKIILSYRISRNISYVNYLKGIVRLKICTLMKARDEKLRLERISTVFEAETSDSLQSPEPEYSIQQFDSIPAIRDDFYGFLSDSQIPACTSLRECFSLIVTHAPQRHACESRSLASLRNYLSTVSGRRNFLILILLSGQSLDISAIENIAKVLDVPPVQIACLEAFRHESREKMLERERKEICIRNHHWLNYIALANAVETEIDHSRKKELIELRERSIRRLHAKCERLSASSTALSSRRLSKLIGIAQSTVSKAARDAREALARIAEESDVSDEKTPSCGKCASHP